jgi:hypothetical protein
MRFWTDHTLPPYRFQRREPHPLPKVPFEGIVLVIVG